MQRSIPSLIALLLVLAGHALAVEPGMRERTFVRSRTLRCREDSGCLPRVGGAAGIAARRRVSQRGRVLQSGECVLPGWRIWSVDRGLPQGNSVPPSRFVFGSKPAPSTLGRPGPLAGTANTVVGARVVLEPLVVVSREGLRVVRRLSAGSSGGMSAVLLRRPRSTGSAR